MDMPADADLLYANGFTIGATNSDVFIILQRNAAPFAVLNMSYTLTKTLVEKLGGLIDDLEERTGHTIMNTSVAGRIPEESK